MTRQQITDQGNKYFHIMENMADDDLDPYQYRLYGHYKRVCGVNGKCWESTAKTAEKTKISVGKVVSTRRELADMGYINLDETSGKTIHVTLNDVMPDNVKRFQNRSSDEENVHHMNANIHHMNQRRTIEEEPNKNTNTMQAPLSTSGVASEYDPAFESDVWIERYSEIFEQIADLKLTKPQRRKLSSWLATHYDSQAEYVEHVGNNQIMNNLVKKGYLAEKDGLYSTKLQDHEYSILFSLTYEQLGETPPAGKKPTHKPFWEAVANMYCWNDNNCSWADYVDVCSKKELATLNGKIKSTCLELDSYHEDNPFTVTELRWIFEHWFNTKFKDLRAKDRKFPVSKDAIRNNMASLRVGYKLYLKNQQSSEE